ncbi:MAG: CaiB/BaiF CoA transferase family protein [Oscillochloridaceae bacterium umkhey_bin13]
MITQALAGIHILEVATYLPGPICTQVLAGMGARVTKVSRVGGDPLLTLQPLDAAYGLLNDGKTELEVDLRSVEGAALLRSLAAEADVLVDGLRPGALARMGLGAEVLRTLNPRLIYCGLSGFSSDSPDRDRGGHDLDFEALSGLLATTSVAGTPALPGTPLADMASGLTAATAILAALYLRTQTGVGATLEAPMLGAARWLMMPWYAVEQARPGERLLTGERAYYRVYATADGRHLAVAALEPHFWGRFCTVLGREDLIARQYEADQERLAQDVAQIVAGRTLADWQAALAGVDACVNPVLSLGEAAAANGPLRMDLPIREL